MRSLLLKLEPIIWFMFGQGILIGTILLTAWILIVGLAIPLGFVSADALSFDRAHALGSNIIGRLVLAALVALPLWKGAHHVRSLALDFGGEERDGVVGGGLYLIALAGTVAAILAVVRL
jgi:fumarate reductase subunit D